MKILKQMVMILFVGLVLVLCGCKLPEEPISVDMFVPRQQDPQTVVQDDGDMARRFTEPDKSSEGETVASWVRRYDKLSEKAEKLSEENRQAAAENNRLSNKVVELEKELEKTKAELDDAVKFLGDMQIELVNWKRDVLGHRDRIEAAHTVQIEYLTRIVKLLGGEAVDVEQKPSAEAQKDE